MFSFTLLASTLAVFETAIVNRGIATAQVDSLSGTTNYVGVVEGLEWVQVPNPIVTSLAVGSTAAVMDSRACFLVKCVRDMETNQTSGLAQTTTSVVSGQTVTTILPLLQRTALGTWVNSHSVPVTLTSADSRSWPAHQVSSNFWFLESPDFGVWQ